MQIRFALVDRNPKGNTAALHVRARAISLSSIAIAATRSVGETSNSLRSLSYRRRAHPAPFCHQVLWASCLPLFARQLEKLRCQFRARARVLVFEE